MKTPKRSQKESSSCATQGEFDPLAWHRARHPRGVGIYLRHIPANGRGYGTPNQAAAKAADHGLQFVCLMGPWHDESGQRDATPDGRAAEYAQGFQERGIEVWLWGYPDPRTLDSWGTRMVEKAKALGAVGLLADPERPWKTVPDKVSAMSAFGAWAIQSGYPVGVTSYGSMKIHRDLKPFVGRGAFGSPQYYTRAPRLLAGDIETWRSPGWPLVPSVPTFGPNAADLKNYVAQIADACQGDCKGVIAWSWPSTSAAEWQSLSSLVSLFPLSPQSP